MDKRNDSEVTPAVPSGSWSFYEDTGARHSIIEKHADQLFSTPPDEKDIVDIEACCVTPAACKAERIRTREGLNIFLNETEYSDQQWDEAASTPSNRIFFLQKPHSRSALSISREALHLLLSRTGSSTSSFSTLLPSIGTESGPYSDGISTFSSRTHDSGRGVFFETSYILKHVEHHGRDGTMIPWSIRQMGVYQRYEVSSRKSDCILVQASANVQRRFAELTDDDCGKAMRLSNWWSCFHEILLGTVTRNWSQYIKLLDGLIDDIGLSVKFTQVGADKPTQLTFLDLQKLNQFSELLVRISHALNLNLEVLSQLSDTVTDRRSRYQMPEGNDEFLYMLRDCRTQHLFLRHHVSLVKENADRLGVQLRDTIALQDSNTMLTLTQKTIQEAQTVKTITFVALVYLPATFTASFLDIGVIHVKSLSGIMKLDVSNDLWLYVAITLPLMFVTILIWWAWDLRMRSRVPKDLEDLEGGRLKRVSSSFPQ